MLCLTAAQRGNKTNADSNHAFLHVLGISYALA
jgi:hypothetical protein